MVSLDDLAEVFGNTGMPLRTLYVFVDGDRRSNILMKIRTLVYIPLCSLEVLLSNSVSQLDRPLSVLLRSYIRSFDSQRAGLVQGLTRPSGEGDILVGERVVGGVTFVYTFRLHSPRECSMHQSARQGHHATYTTSYKI